ncbi:two-component system regulatory protein YycI [Amphibacillus sediminis]|uniref:two-component system regulatory protein YycI n=1 Tax=Amphibacillus sediminis TaxID=360185 RepID=UPI00082A7251|nr:two-component system regulatory protein YycI [Amphibacillus sediminis]
MQWGQIKSLFIICFLILNVFLVKQLYDRQDENFSFIPEASKEEELELNISGLDSLSDESFSAPLIYAQNFNYNKEAADQLESLANQEIVVVDDYLLYSRFTEPMELNFEDPELYPEMFNQMVFNGGSYSYWGKIERANMLVFFQQMEHPIFYNPNALLLIQLNADGEMVHYIQTRLKIVEEEEESQSLITQYDAVYRLYHNSNALQAGDSISHVTLGYHNLVSLPNGEQVLNPTWSIEVNETDYRFINAVEGHSYPSNRTFIEDSIGQWISKVDMASSSDRVVNYRINQEDENDLVEALLQTLRAIRQNMTEVESE